MSEELQAMYQDFNICCQCDTVLLKSEKECTKCGHTNFLPFEEQIANLGAIRGGLGCIVAILALVIGGLAGGPLGIAAALPFFWIGTAINTNGNNARRTRKIRYMNEAVKLLRERALQQKAQIMSNYEAGSQHFSNENFSDAISLFEEGISIGDTSKILRYKLAISYYNTGQYDQALPILEDLADDPHFPEAKELLARNIIRLGIVGERLEQLKMLKGAIEKKEAQDHITLAIADYYYFNQVNAADDIDLIATALSLRPTEARYLELLLNYHVSQGRIDEVIKLCLDFSWEAHSKETVLIWAQIYSNIREINDTAIKVYTRALHDYPGNKDVRVALAEALISV